MAFLKALSKPLIIARGKIAVLPSGAAEPRITIP